MRARSDGGFTLIELLITITLVGIVSIAISGAAIVVLRVYNPTSDQVSVSRALHGLNAWLPADAAGAVEFDRSSNCGGALNDPNIVVDMRSATGTRIATYRRIDGEIRRFTCDGPTEVVAVTGAIDAGSIVSEFLEADGTWDPNQATEGVRITAQTDAGETFSYFAGSRLP